METNIDFRWLKSDERFQEMCNQLVVAENPDAKAVDGRGGDMGIDSFVGTLEQPDTIFQYKYFCGRLDSSRKSQIEKSLEVASKRNPRSWILITPLDFTLGESRWFNRLELKYPAIKIEYWGNSKLLAMLLRNPHVLETYFPNKVMERLNELNENVIKMSSSVVGKSSPKPDRNPSNTRTESREGEQIDVIPSWFRAQRAIMERIEKMTSRIAWQQDNDEKSNVQLDDFKEALSDSLCGNDLVITSEICSERSSSRGVWDYVANEILKGRGTNEDILSFLLYEVRAALLLKSYHYVQQMRNEIGPREWLQVVNAFHTRWNRIVSAVRYSGSLEDRLPDDIFDGFVLKEDVDPIDGEKYLNLVYEAVKWHSITRNASNSSFYEEYERTLDNYYRFGRKLLNKANQHKVYKLRRHART
ncbi:MAG: hypothetical protein M1587_04990 [Thaumarchaeota archaeon]|nr:hypothetical protein [Nitrososphaerota archaeon]